MSAESVTAVLIPAQMQQPLETKPITGFRDIQRLAEMVIPVDIEPRALTMWVDAHDRYKGVPMNLRATSLRWYWDPASRRLPALHGDVLLVGDAGSTIAIGDVPDTMRRDLLQRGPYGVEVQLDSDGSWTQRPGVFETYADAAMWAVLVPEREREVRTARIAEIRE